MKNVQLRLIVVVISFLACTFVAQSQDKHEVSGWLGGGLSTLDYKVNGEKAKNGVGGLFGVGYNYHLTTQWSIGTGIEISLYQGKTPSGDFSEAYKTNDGEYDFELRSIMNNYQEKQKTYLLNIPILGQYRMELPNNIDLYFSGGVKVGLPISSKYKVSEGELKNVGYYEQWSEQGGRELIMDSQEFMGFGTYDQSDLKEDFKVKTAFMLSLETGVKWLLGQSNSLYTGIYFDYGLNDINKYTNKRLVEYNAESPVDFKRNSIVQSNLGGKIKPMAIGLKVRYGFTF